MLTIGLVYSEGSFDLLIFSDLDDELQTSLYDFLEMRGINDELAVFLHKCMQHKSKNEYIRWMGSVESFVARKK